MSKNLFFFLLIIISSSLFSISSTTWIGAWMGLEINMMMFMPLINKTNKSLSNESSLKYFLVQSLASTFFLMASIMNSLSFNMFNNSFIELNFNNLIIISALVLKLGASPFHNWFLGVIEGLNWLKTLILLTWQKIAPLFLMLNCKMSTNLLTLFIILSALFGSIGGLNQTSMRKIMVYSSISHLGWMFMSMLYSKYMLIMYFMSYTFISTMVIMLFYSLKMYNFYHLFKYQNKIKNLLITSLLSLGGLPPLLGFTPKFLIIYNMIYSELFLLMLFLIMASLVTLFFYVRMIFSSLLIMNNSLMFMYNQPLTPFKMKFISSLTAFNMIGILFFPMISF